MTRLQKKCLVVSLACHGLLMVTVLATAAFHSEPVITQEQILHFINLPVQDRPGVGGQPVAVPKPVAATPVSPNPAPAPSPVQPRSEPVARTVAPAAQPQRHVAEPTRTVAKTNVKPVETKTTATKPSPEATPKRHVVTPDLTPVSSSRTSTRHTEATTESQSSAQDQRKRTLQEISSAFASLNSSLDSKEPSSKVVPLPGLDSGEAFINYRTFIFNRYYQAWLTPDGGRSLVADAKIVVSRNGDIISAQIITKSGDATLDRSVERALDSVKQLPPFPAQSTDTQRTFILRFDLSAKNSEG